MNTKEWPTGWLISATLTLLIAVIYGWGGFEWLELRAYDLHFAIRGPRPLSDRVVLVIIDEESLQKLSTTLREFKRSILAQAIERLASSGARLIGIDLVLSNPSGHPDDDDQLRDVLTRAGNVILPRFISSEMTIPPLAVFRDVEMGEGLINVALDEDGVLRSIPILSAEVYEEELVPYLSFSVEIARLLSDPEGTKELDLSQPDEIRIGSLSIPNPDNKMLINFYGPPGTFPHLPIWQVVRGNFPHEWVSGKIILIGSYTPSGYDVYRTPFSGGVQKVLAPWGGRTDLIRLDRMYGVEIHANALQTVLDKSFIRRAAPGVVWAMVALLGLISAAILWLVRRFLWTTTLFGLLTASIPITSVVLFILNNLWIDLVPSTTTIAINYLGGVAYQRYVEGKEKKRIANLFGRYVSAQVVERLIQNPSLLHLGGTKKRLTILFSDIRGFTTMSEQMDPAEVSRLLNEYFKEMTRLIFKHDGTLDKFIGDAILVFFGDPIPYTDHALRAVKVALEMQETMKRLNQKWLGEGKPLLTVGIGVNTGTVTVGNMGSEEFVDYTVIGDEVNLACRLEENAQGGQILITQNTYDEIKGEIGTRSLGSISVKGKIRLIPVYEVLGLYPSIRPSL